MKPREAVVNQLDYYERKQKLIYSAGANFKSKNDPALRDKIVDCHSSIRTLRWVLNQPKIYDA